MDDARDNLTSEPGQAATSSYTRAEHDALVRDIVREMRKDSLKVEVSEKLKGTNWARVISNFFQHPAVLLVMGFLITGVIGVRLANQYQLNASREEWERQQRRLLDLHAIELKYAVVDEVTKAVGERNAAARELVAPLLPDKSYTDLVRDEREPGKTWQTVDHQWIVSSNILRLKIAMHLKSKGAADIFRQIVESEKSIGGDITYLRNHFAEYSRLERREKDGLLQPIVNSIQRSEEMLKNLVDVVAEETRADINAQAYH